MAILKVFIGLILVVSTIAIILAFWAIIGKNSDINRSTYVNSLGIEVDRPEIINLTKASSSVGDVIFTTQTEPEAQIAELDPSEAHNYEDIDSLFHSIGINLHQKDAGADQSSQDSINYCKRLVYDALAPLPAYHAAALSDLTLSLSTEGKRGLAGNGLLILRCTVSSDEELVAVLLHEMGHIVDGSYLTGTVGSGKSGFVDLGTPVTNDDESVGYYKLSWKNNYNFKDGVAKNDFCSDYGQTDPYEDFAECYIYYILHGEEFRQASEGNTILEAKYEFLKTEVFAGIEYYYDKGSTPSERVVPTDVVQLPYNYTSFLNQ